MGNDNNDMNEFKNMIEEVFYGKKLKNGKRAMPTIINKDAVKNMSKEDLEELNAIFNKSNMYK